MQKIIVTGGAGFIGRHLVKSLLEKNYEVHVIDILIDEFTRERISDDVLLKYFNSNFIKNNVHQIDILDYEKISPLFNNAYGVIHLAAFISSPNSINEPMKAFDTNIKGTLHVLESARNNGCKNVILTSSAAVYGSLDGIKKEEDITHPENPYGLSKFIDEQLGKLYNDLYKINIACVRYSNVWGPDQHDVGSYAPAIGRFIKEAKNNNPMPICGDGEQTRDFIHVYDVVKANIKILENIEKENVRGEVFNVCSGIESVIIDIANLVANIFKEKNNINAEIIHIAPRIEPRRFVGDNTKIKNAIKWEPTVTLEEGIRELL